MRIALIHNLPSGGGKRAAFEFVKFLATHHSIDLYLIDETSEHYLDLRPMVEKTFVIPGPTPKGGIGVLAAVVPAMRAYKQIADRVNAANYDVAFVMQCKLSNTPSVLRYLRIPSLYFCHEPWARTLEAHFWMEKDRRFLRRWAIKAMVGLDQMNARHATRICANSRFSVESIYRAYGVYARYSQMGVDTEAFRPLHLERSPVVLSVGALHPGKAQDLIIDAVGTLDRRPTVQFIHNSGAKDYKEQLQRLANQRGVTVTFSQLVGEDDLVNAYNHAAVVAFPSSMEPFGLVPLESMACGTPVVGVAEGGVRETIVHGVTGFLADRNAAAFGRALDGLLRDEALSNRIGAAGRKHVLEHWTWDRATAMLDGHLRDLHNDSIAATAKQGRMAGMRSDRDADVIRDLGSS